MTEKGRTAADPISPAPVTEWQPQALPPYLSNGCIGLGQRPLSPGVAVLNRLEGVHPVDEVPGFGRIPYPLGGDVLVGDVRMSDAPDRCILREQRCDFSTGEVTTSWVFDAGPSRVSLTSTVLCSRTQPGLVLELLTASVETVGVPPATPAPSSTFPGRLTHPTWSRSTESCAGAPTATWPPPASRTRRAWSRTRASSGRSATTSTGSSRRTQ